MKPVRGDIHVLTSILVTNTSKPFFAEFTWQATFTFSPFFHTMESWEWHVIKAIKHIQHFEIMDLIGKIRGKSFNFWWTTTSTHEK
jgi:hypothetical protein